TILVRHRAHDALGFVEHEVALVVVDLHRRAVDLHLIEFGVDAPPLLGDDLTIDRHPPLRDVLLAHAARRHSCRREYLLQTLARGLFADHRDTNSSKPSAPSGSRGDMGGSSSIELMPSWVSSSGVVS